MATAAAALLIALALGAAVAPAAAPGVEADPVRRSLVVQAVERASPAVVNVSTEQVIEQRVQDHAEGERVRLTRRREDREDEVTLRTAGFPTARADDLAWQRLGLGLAQDDDGITVKRIRAGSPAGRIGIQPGDRLLGLGGTPTATLAEFRRRMIEVRDARGVLLSVGRGPYQYNVNVPLAR